MTGSVERVQPEADVFEHSSSKNLDRSAQNFRRRFEQVSGFVRRLFLARRIEVQGESGKGQNKDLNGQKAVPTISQDETEADAAYSWGRRWGQKRYLPEE